MNKRGVLLVNLGTPDAATPRAVKRFLREFLWDRRVVDVPRPIWWLLLNGLILPLRARRVARNYASIWTGKGSPLLAVGRRQQQALASRLDACGDPMPVELAMTYGEPSLQQGWQRLQAAGVEEVILLPLYPQYSSTTTAPVLDAWGRLMAREHRVPSLRFISHYHDHPAYIAALVQSVHHHWQLAGRGQFLLLSFHGIPERYARRGDPYPEQCQQTAALLAQSLGLEAGRWGVSYQSRFGREPWLQPYTDERLLSLAQEGIRQLDVICPAFAADCLETIEEIGLEGRRLFEGAGGERYHYIPALNDADAHIELLCQLVREA